MKVIFKNNLSINNINNSYINSSGLIDITKNKINKLNIIRNSNYSIIFNCSLIQNKEKSSISNILFRNSIKNFSRNSTQWLNRHTNDLYVKKSVEVRIFEIYNLAINLDYIFFLKKILLKKINLIINR